MSKCVFGDFFVIPDYSDHCSHLGPSCPETVSWCLRLGDPWLPSETAPCVVGCAPKCREREPRRVLESAAFPTVCSTLACGCTKRRYRGPNSSRNGAPKHTRNHVRKCNVFEHRTEKRNRLFFALVLTSRRFTNTFALSLPLPLQKINEDSTLSEVCQPVYRPRDHVSLSLLKGVTITSSHPKDP